MTDTSKRDCPFCDADERHLRATDHSAVLLSNPRLQPGHTLVVPKRHVEEPWQLTAEELQDIFTNIWWVEGRLLASDLAEGIDIRQNYRPFLPQSRTKVDHLHFHVIPRTYGDKLYTDSMQHERFDDLAESEREQIMGLLQ